MKREKRWLLNNGEYSLIKLNNYSWKVIVNYELKISLYSDRSCLTKPTVNIILMVKVSKQFHATWKQNANTASIQNLR